MCFGSSWDRRSAGISNRTSVAVSQSFRKREEILKNSFRGVMNRKTRHLYGFGRFRLDAEECLLLLDGKPLPLPPKAFEALLFLVENAGHLVDKDELMKKVWPDTFVEDGNVAKHVSLLRKILSEATNGREYIETIPKRGYRFVAEVKDIAEPGTSSQPHVGPDASFIGKRISHYRVLEIIGGGGMGVVYKAEDIKLGRRVALKFLPEELINNSTAMERFEREARAASALNHPNICTIYEVEEYEGQPFIVMELLEGQTLRDLIPKEGAVGSKAPLHLDTLVDVAVQIVEGLEAAHKQGIIHRDIKPANIFLTTQGRAKILDFGLAKLQESEIAGMHSPSEVIQEPRHGWHPHLILTRTGTTIGTAGYMSPEQIRGEKLDARSDLFSFGLVLYEMATGQRAFAGETAPVLRAAILNEAPKLVRQLNPEIPPKLERVISRALEKDRELRYQSASEMEVDLRKLGAVGKEALLRRVAAVSVFGLLLVVGSLFWFAKLQQPSLLELKQRQLTINASENAIVSGAISPDGRYLAYADLQGIHVKAIETGEAHTVPQPESLKGFQVNWGIVPTWVRDGTRFIANANIPGQRRSIWVVPVRGGAPHKLRDDATAWSVSRDGSWIAISTNEGTFGDREIWRISPDGQEAQKLYEAGENSGFMGGAEWSPDGQRVAYMKYHETPEQAESAILSQDMKGGPAVVAVRDFVIGYSWSPDGRIIYSRQEPGSASENCNFWGVRIDARTGKPREQAKRLTNWAFCMDSPSITADGKRLTFRRWLPPQSNVFVSDLEGNGTRISTPKRLTLDDRLNLPAAWTPDSNAVVFRSYRDGQWRILKQRLNEDSAEIIVSGADAGSAMGARVSPEGAWLLYTAPPSDNASSSFFDLSIPLTRLMRVPIMGGSSELVFNARLPDYGVYNDPVCARAPSKLCVITEQTADRKQLIFTAFDPIRGRGHELARYEITWPGAYDWDLSPDGSRLAISKYSGQQIHILPLNGDTATNIVVKGWSSLWSLNWAADGKGLFVSSATQSGSALLRVDLKGNANVLWQQKRSIAPWSAPLPVVIGPSAPWAVPSPDGRHLAIYQWNLNANIWMMENF